MSHESAAWHPDTVSLALQQTLTELQQASVLLPFYLAGGTGLALQLGHRHSEDLDFFASESFDSELVLQNLGRLGGLSVLAKSPQTLHVQFRGAKVSFLDYTYRLLLHLAVFQGAKVADARDIACMKISAIAGRGTKRDFIDLYFAAQRYGLPRLLELFQEKFPEVNYSSIHLLKSLTYFEDAEKDPSPDMLLPLSWEEVKEFFRREAPRLF